MTETEQIQFIRDNYLQIPVKTMANIIGRSHCFVAGRMRKMNLIVPAEIIAKRKEESQFKPGNRSFNKGKKQSEYMSAQAIERSRATQFKKGNKPHNTKSDGAISWRSDGYAYIRLSEGKWDLYHRVLYAVFIIGWAIMIPQLIKGYRLEKEYQQLEKGGHDEKSKYSPKA